jgi:ectoine hydroxylase-related dioxygenase (phytanoyl-CoA dioxygenase family)
MTMETAQKYKKTQSHTTDKFPPELIEEYFQALNKQGYIIIPDVLSQQQLADIKEQVKPLLNNTGRNYFEGELTQRIYSVIAKTFACNHMVEHPLILALLDRLFHPGYLLSQLQVINILSGEKQQPIHTDDAFYALPRPRQPLGAATVWAIDDFTTENGGTVVIPGSHKWGEGMPTEEQLKQQINCEMTAGSVVFFLGTLWHGGGANHSKNSRLAVTAQYCEGFCRSQENFSLSIPQEKVSQCSEDIKRLLGYSIYGPFMGMVDGKHPKRLLEKYR